MMMKETNYTKAGRKQLKGLYEEGHPLNRVNLWGITIRGMSHTYKNEMED